MRLIAGTNLRKEQLPELALTLVVQGDLLALLDGQTGLFPRPPGNRKRSRIITAAS